jgi:S-ribosylhomocysteine lyase LuxS involved in autoinducer biosynthesis
MEIRSLQQHLMNLDPELYKSTVPQEKVKECGDCKNRDVKLAEAENRIKVLTEYI